jgi:hypothetical protein
VANLDLFSGLIGAFLAVLASGVFHMHSYINAEKFFFRERRVETCRQLFVMRFCLQNGYTPSLEEARKFNEAINAIPFDFMGDTKVIDQYNEFVSDPNNTASLTKLISVMSESGKIRRKMNVLHTNRTMALRGSDERRN